MKNQNGITLMLLVVIIVIMSMVAGLTFVSSRDNYRNMKFDTFKAEMEELQSAVDAMCEDFSIYKNKNDNASLTYQYFFEANYGNTSPPKLENINTEEAQTIKDKYPTLNDHQETTFYFTQDDIEKYFDLKGINYDIIVDFSTRYVYSVEGCKNPDNTEEIYYTRTDYEDDKVITDTDSKKVSAMSTVVATGTSVTLGNTPMFKVELNIGFNTSGSSYPITNVYYSNDGTNWIEIKDYQENLTNLTNSSVEGTIGSVIKAVLYEKGSYTFRVKDSSGKVVESNSVTYN